MMTGIVINTIAVLSISTFEIQLVTAIIGSVIMLTGFIPFVHQFLKEAQKGWPVKFE